MPYLSHLFGLFMKIFCKFPVFGYSTHLIWVVCSDIYASFSNIAWPIPYVFT